MTRLWAGRPSVDPWQG